MLSLLRPCAFAGFIPTGCRIPSMINLRIFTTLCLVLCIGSAASHAFAAAPSWTEIARNEETDPVSLSVQTGYLYGSTSYHTKFTGGESKLEFPLQTVLAGVSGEIGSTSSRTEPLLKLKATWLANIGRGSGNMKDSDWLTDDNHPGKDIYSESDIKLDAVVVDIRGVYEPYPSAPLSIGIFAGYGYRHYRYEVSNTREVGYGPYATDFTGTFPGKSLNYDVTFEVPYVGFHVGSGTGAGFHAALDLGYSPWAAVTDTDDHLLRYKKSTSDTTGQVYLAELNAQWDVTKDDLFQVSCEAMSISTKGKQTQTWYRTVVVHDPLTGQTTTIYAGDTFSGIDDRIASLQTTLMALFTHRF